MPLHDYRCSSCEHNFEEFVKWDQYCVACPVCGQQAKRMYQCFNGMKSENPTWLYDTLKVVDKDGGKHCQEFLKNPNRDNYKNWMKGEGLRPIEKGEKLRSKEIDTSGIRSAVHNKFKTDNAITIR